MFRTAVLCLFIFLLAGNSAAAVAKPLPEKQVKSPSQAAKEAKKHIDGRVLKVDKTKSSFRVKMLKKSGRVVTVDVDKDSGRVKQSKRKDDN